MEPLDFQNPYGDKLVRKKKYRKNKVEEQAGQDIHNNKNDNGNALRSDSVYKNTFQDNEDYIMDMVYLNRKASETKSKSYNDDDINEKEDNLPVLPKPLETNQLPKIENKIPDQTTDTKKPGKKNFSKLTIALFIIIGVLVVLVIVLLILTIVFGVKSSENESSSQSTTARPTSCSYGFSGPDCSDQCGLVYFSGNVRIAGGVTAIQHSWPSIVLIEFKYKLDYQDSGNNFSQEISSTCAGTLVNRNTVLTAAHCLIEYVNFTANGNSFSFQVVENNYYPTFESMYTVYLGFHDITDVFAQNIVYPGRKVSVMSFIRHPQFDSNDLKNDIAVIKLRSSVSLDSYVQLACLPQNSNYPAGVDVWTAGWGDSTDNNNNNLVTFQLQNVQLSWLEMNECENVSIGLFKDSADQICAGDPFGQKGVCSGDEGGPLFVKDQVNGVERFVLVGITSYRQSCAPLVLPAIFTNVNSYSDWINLYF